MATASCLIFLEMKGNRSEKEDIFLCYCLYLFLLVIWEEGLSSIVIEKRKKNWDKKDYYFYMGLL